jgi:hypothetical protein
MTYLPGFRHDVFTSYAHGDFERAGTSYLKKWSLAFKRELQAELSYEFGSSNISIFIDENQRPDQGLDKNDPLTAQLRAAASGAALLLILMSPYYLDSDWCRDELSWWREQTGTEVFPEVGNRILVAHIWPTRGLPWPEVVCDERGHPQPGVLFHRPPSGRPFNWPDPTGAAGDFRDAILELTGQIKKRIDKLSEALERKRRAAADIAKLRADGGQLIYVHARARDKVHWERACDELISAGYGVLPMALEADNDPRQTVVDEKEIIRALSGCDGLLLVPGDDPRSLYSDLAVVGRQWRNSARAIAHRLLPCAVVDRGLMLDAKPRWQRSAKNYGIDWIDAAIIDWTGQVRSWLSAVSASQSGVA